MISCTLRRKSLADQSTVRRASPNLKSEFLIKSDKDYFKWRTRQRYTDCRISCHRSTRTSKTSSVLRTGELLDWEELEELRVKRRDLEWDPTCLPRVVISILLGFTQIQQLDWNLGISRVKKVLSGWTCLNRFQITTACRRRVNYQVRRADLPIDNPVLVNQQLTRARVVVSTAMTWSSKVCSCRDSSSDSLKLARRIKLWDADSRDPPQLITSLANIIELTVHFANRFWHKLLFIWRNSFSHMIVQILGVY